jgi:uncharacterized protein YukE
MSSAEMRDPEVLRQFIATLQTFNSELQNRSRNLSGHWASLQQVWRDRQCDAFAAEWETTVQAIDRYLRGCDRHVADLQTRLRQMESYGERS